MFNLWSTCVGRIRNFWWLPVVVLKKTHCVICRLLHVEFVSELQCEPAAWGASHLKNHFLDKSLVWSNKVNKDTWQLRSVKQYQKRFITMNWHKITFLSIQDWKTTGPIIQLASGTHCTVQANFLCIYVLSTLSFVAFEVVCLQFVYRCFWLIKSLIFTMTISQGVIIFLNHDNRIRHKLVLGKSKVAVLAYVVKKNPL